MAHSQGTILLNLIKSDFTEFIVLIPKSRIVSVQSSFRLSRLCNYTSCCSGISFHSSTAAVPGATPGHLCAGFSGEFCKRSNHCALHYCITELVDVLFCCFCEVKGVKEGDSPEIGRPSGPSHRTRTPCGEFFCGICATT